jgi:hypothetical protein
MKAVIAIIAVIGMMGSGAAMADSFGGNACKTDCSGHQAGYNWAQQNGISDESACKSNSNSFNEGCRTFVEENSTSKSESPQDDDDSDDDGDD